MASNLVMTDKLTIQSAVSLATSPRLHTTRLDFDKEKPWWCLGEVVRVVANMC